MLTDFARAACAELRTDKVRSDCVVMRAAPPTAEYGGNPTKKTLHAFRIRRGWMHFEKDEWAFSWWGSAKRQGWRGSNAKGQIASTLKK